MISDPEVGPIVRAIIPDEQAPIELRIAAIRSAGALHLQEAAPLVLPLLEDEILRDIALPVVTVLGATVSEHSLRAWLSEDWGRKPPASICTDRSNAGGSCPPPSSPR